MFTIPLVFFILWLMQDEESNKIRINNVSFSYNADDPAGKEEPALRNVTMEFDRGSYVAILGANGSGKSTLAKLIDVLEIPSRGSIAVFGYDTTDSKYFWKIRQNCSLVFQNPDNQIVGTTVEEDVAFGPENLGIPNPELRQRVDDALKATGLYGSRHKQPSQMSGGQKQKLAIAGALAMDPQILILDESTAMLDPVSRNDFIDLVENMRKQRDLTLITITHDMDEAARCGKIFVMKDGKVYASGTPDEVFRKDSIITEAGLDRPVPYKYLTCVSELTGNTIPEDTDINIEDNAARIAAGMIADCKRVIRPDDDAGKGQDASARTIMTIRDLSFSYSESKFRLNDVNLDIRESEILAIVGQSGCGKTTLISHMNALITPQHGEVLINSSEGTLNTAVKSDIRKIRSKVGLVFQYPEYQLFEETVYKDIEYGLKKAGVPEEERESRIKEALSLVGLDESVLEKSPFDLSGGQKRRVAIAGVLVMKPEILVLDEPASGLDPIGRHDMFRTISRFRDNGTSIVIVTHNMDEAALNADRICCIGNGEVLSVTTPEEMFADPGNCRKMGIDIPRLTSFSNKVRDILIKDHPGVRFGGPHFDIRKEVLSILTALQEGGSHVK